MESRRTVIATSSCLPPPSGGRLHDQIGGVIIKLTTKLVLSSTFYFCLNSLVVIIALVGLLRQILMFCLLICDLKNIMAFFLDRHLPFPLIFTTSRPAVTRSTIPRISQYPQNTVDIIFALQSLVTIVLFTYAIMLIFLRNRPP